MDTHNLSTMLGQELYLYNYWTSIGWIKYYPSKLWLQEMYKYMYTQCGCTIDVYKECTHQLYITNVYSQCPT